MSAETHYILPITERNGRFQLSACNRWVLDRDHSTEPTCATCAAYLLDDSRELSTEDVVARFGDFSPAAIVKANHFNPTAGYRPRERNR